MAKASNIKIEDLIISPLSILAVNDSQVLNKLDNLIPYSSAFEIECDMKPGVYNVENFKIIPNIMNVSNDTWEQRYRIPRGIKGIICLYHISRQLKINSLLNPKSSIHYHVDCSDSIQGKVNLVHEKIYKNKSLQDWILLELDTWLEKPGDACSRAWNCWAKCNDHQTIEFRLGEMTFDYNIILKRIIHCNAIVRKIKKDLDIFPIECTSLSLEDKKVILEYEKAVLPTLGKLEDKELILKAKLETILKNTEEDLKKLEENKNQEESIEVKTRVHKLF